MTFQARGVWRADRNGSAWSSLSSRRQRYALGGGFELALACDIIVAASTPGSVARAARGWMASDGGVHRVVRQLPLKIGMGMLASGRQVGGE